MERDKLNPPPPNAPHIAILPSPGIGHLIPLAEFAKHLAIDHGFAVTFLTFPSTSSKEQHSLLATLPPSISSLSLPPVDLSDAPTFPTISGIVASIHLTFQRGLPTIRSALRSLHDSGVGRRLVAYVTDIFGCDTYCLARELGIPAYFFSTTSLFWLSHVLHLPSLHETTSFDPTAILELPGCVPLRHADFMEPLNDPTDVMCDRIVQNGRLYWQADGILANSFFDMEPGAAKALAEVVPGRPPVYLVGPLTRSPEKGGSSSECIRWLDEQPTASVLYVSFGSGGALTSAQQAELAAGLELSAQRFLWVVRSPSDKDASAAYFDAGAGEDPVKCLPDGFLERTKGRGLVVPSWAPQVLVLQHHAVWGFLSHVGWNSTLESTAHGVPMIAWPLYAEQRMNALMLADEAKVALRPRGWEEVGGLVGREEVARLVKELMEGEEGKVVRVRARELRVAGAKALAEEGCSYKAFAELVSKWK